MKHLITGGSGFLGNLIARRLLAGGEEVRILDVWEDPSLGEIEFVHCDVRDRVGSSRDGGNRCGPSQRCPGSVDESGRAFRVNVNGRPDRRRRGRRPLK